MLALTGGTATAALAGCLGVLDDGEDDDDETAAGQSEEHAGVAAEVTAYVVPYHWGYAVFDEHGEELDQLEIETGTELTVHAVNDHAYDAFGDLPEPVAEQLEDFDGLGRTKEKVEAGELPEPEHGTVEEVYEKAHGHSHNDDGHGHDDDEDHGHDDDDDGHGHDGDDGHGHDDDDGHGHDDDHDHEGAMLDHGFMIEDSDIMMEVPADADELVTVSDVFEEPGTYQAMCQVVCGYYHTEQIEDLVVVTEH